MSKYVPFHFKNSNLNFAFVINRLKTGTCRHLSFVKNPVFINFIGKLKENYRKTFYTIFNTI